MDLFVVGALEAGAGMYLHEQSISLHLLNEISQESSSLQNVTVRVDTLVGVFECFM